MEGVADMIPGMSDVSDRIVAANNALRIAHLKQRASKLCLSIHSRTDGLSCGAKLADFIRPDIPKNGNRIQFGDGRACID